MYWNTIKVIFESYISKIFTLLSIVTLILSTPFINAFTNKSLLFLSIAILVFLFAYIIYIVFVPNIIKDYQENKYVSYMVSRGKSDTLSLVTEFKCLEDTKNQNLYIYKDETYNFSKVIKIEDFQNSKIDDIYQLATIKYAYLNSRKLIARWIITISLFTFLICFYYISIEKLLTYIENGVM